MPPPSRPKPGIFRATLRGVPELDQFPTPLDRDRALEEMASPRPRDFALGIAITIACVGGAALLMKFAVMRLWPFGGTRIAMDVATPLAAIGACVLTLRALHLWGARAHLRRSLLACAVPVCLKCGYSLRGLAHDAPACPECGEAPSDRAREILGGTGAGR